MSTTTKYTVITFGTEGTETEVGVKSKKATAVDLARQTRKEQNTGVKVVTSAGTVVFELAAPKKIKMSPKYTRVVELPEGIEVPEGKRPVFYRPRRHSVMLHDAETGDYTIFDTRTNKELEGEVFTTTRATDERIKELVKL